MKLKTLCSVAAMTVAGLGAAQAEEMDYTNPRTGQVHRVVRCDDGVWREQALVQGAVQDQSFMGASFAANAVANTPSFDVNAFIAEYLNPQKAGQTLFFDPQNENVNCNHKLSYQFTKSLQIVGLGGINAQGQPHFRAALGDGDHFVVPKNNQTLAAIKDKLDKGEALDFPYGSEEFNMLSALARATRMVEESGRRLAEAYKYMENNAEAAKGLQTAMDRHVNRPKLVINMFEGQDVNANVNPYGSLFRYVQVNYFDAQDPQTGQLGNSSKDGDVSHHEMGHWDQFKLREDIFMAMTPAARSLLEGEADLGSFLTLVDNRELTSSLQENDLDWIFKSGEYLAKLIGIKDGHVRNLDKDLRLTWERGRGASGHEEHDAGHAYVGVYWDAFKEALNIFRGTNTDKSFGEALYTVGHAFGLGKAAALALQPAATMSSNLRTFHGLMDTFMGTLFGDNVGRIKQVFADRATNFGFGVGQQQGEDERNPRWTQPMRPGGQQYVNSYTGVAFAPQPQSEEEAKHNQHWNQMYEGMIQAQYAAQMAAAQPQLLAANAVTEEPAYPVFKFPGLPANFTFPKTVEELFSGQKRPAANPMPQPATPLRPQIGGLKPIASPMPTPRPQTGGLVTLPDGRVQLPDGRIGVRQPNGTIRLEMPGAASPQRPQQPQQIGQIRQVGRDRFELQTPQGVRVGRLNSKGHLVFEPQGNGFVFTPALIFAFVEGAWMLIKSAYDLYQKHHHEVDALVDQGRDLVGRGSRTARDGSRSSREGHRSRRHHGEEMGYSPRHHRMEGTYSVPYGTPVGFAGIPVSPRGVYGTPVSYYAQY